MPKPAAINAAGASIPLTRLQAWAREWDVESDGAHYTATRFVGWVTASLGYEGPGVLAALEAARPVSIDRPPGGPGKLRCESCGVAFLSSGGLADHRRIQHPRTAGG